MRRRRQTKSLMGGKFGAKALTIGEWDMLLDLAVSLGNSDSADELYRAVSWVFWCVNRRANAIGQMPYAVYPLEVEDDDPKKEVEDFIDLRPMLWQVEAWLALEAKAYVYKRLEDEDLQVLNAYRMRIKEHDDRGPTLFEFRGDKGQIIHFTPDELLYFRTWNPRSDIEAGVPSSSPGRTPSKIIRHTSEWAEAFFRNGAVPLTILTTDQQQPTDKQVAQIRGQWNELFRGALNQFKTAILGRGLKPEVIGQPVDDLAMPELSKESKEQILASNNLPPGLAEPKTNRAERDALKLEAYETCYIPEWEVFVEPVVNEQLLHPLGLRLAGHPEQLEIFQIRELEKGEAMAFAISGVALPAYKENTMSVDEVRSWIDAVGQAANLPALDESFEPEERTPPALQPFTGQQPQEDGDNIEGAPTSAEDRIESRTGKALLVDLDKWERKAITRIQEGRPGKALEFASDIIPAVMHRMIVHSLEAALTLGDVQEVFKAARGQKQLQFIPEGQGDPLPPVPGEVTISDADIDRAIRTWNRHMVDYRGLLGADVTHRENFE
jgi:hypothetical protein